MTESESARIDHYLLGEMETEAHEEFESRLIASDELYYALVHRENELVDRYAAKSLDPDLTRRFERSLSTLPARRQKLANARALKTYIAETAKVSDLGEESVPWFRKLGFAFGMPAYAAGVLGLLLIGAVGFLILQNRNQERTIAELRNNSEIEKLRQREAELQSTLENEQTASGDLTSDLEGERERRAKLEAEIKELRKHIANPPANDTPLVPTIATLVLSSAGSRGGPVPVRTLSLSETQKRVSVKLFLPADVASDGDVVVKVNSANVGGPLKPRTGSDGRRSVTFTVPAERFADGPNRIEVLDRNGKAIAEFSVLKKQA